ncbi:MAG: ABC transporter permease [Aestuariivirga sp.]
MKSPGGQFVAAALLAVLWGLPLAAALVAAAQGLIDAEAWKALLDHPQLWEALGLSLFTGTISTLLAFIGATAIVAGLYGTPLWRKLASLSGLFLALPHLAFAIGFGFLIMPGGWIARFLVGGDTPPNWITTQDPWGFSLIAVLALKEIPFLVWIYWTLLARSDISQLLDGHWRSARSLGHASLSVWLRILLPQLVPRIIWPLAVVWVYGSTVVDLALVIGPTQPSTLALIIWSDLNDGDAAANMRGIAGAAFLTLILAAAAAGFWLVLKLITPAWRRFASKGPSHATMPELPALALIGAITFAYLAVLMILLVMSFAGRWPYPAVLPEILMLDAWKRISFDSITISFLLAITASLTASALAVLWLESISERWDKIVSGSAAIALVIPALVIAGGQYQLFLHAGLTGTALGLFLVHLTPVFAYVWIVLKGPYRAFDPRYASVASGLRAGPWLFWRQVKAPLLKSPLLSALAVGFSVSLAQFVPAQLIASGRFSTLPMEAVTLASGGNRSLTAAFALLLAAPPALAFLITARLGKSRWA